MPQATESDRARARALFGSIDCVDAQEWLKKRGYRLDTKWEWTVPEGHTTTDDEFFAVCFLIDEWDYGGIAPTVGDAT